MKEYDLEVNDSNIEQTLKNNVVDRNFKLNKLIEMLNAIEGNKIISIDGNWGSGKTFFLKQLEFLNNCDKDKEFNGVNVDNLKKFRSDYIVYYYDAWKNDMHDLPLLSLIYNMVNDFKVNKSANASGKIEIPFNVVELVKTVTSGFYDISKVKSYNDLINEIKTFEERKQALDLLIETVIPKGKKLIFIVDELDRCNPQYAVNMIEVIKHFYSNNKVIFLLGTNNLQLSHIISSYYGNDFDGYGYLNRIYNFIIELGDVPVDRYVEYLSLRDKSGEWRDISLYSICEYFKFSMREVNRFLNDFNLLVEYFSKNYGFQDDSILKYVFLPYALGLKVKNKNELNLFLSGEGLDSLNKFVLSDQSMIMLINYCSEKKIDNRSANDMLANVLECLKKRYHDYFSSNDIEDWGIKEKKKKFLDIFSLLSGYSTFDKSSLN